MIEDEEQLRQNDHEEDEDEVDGDEPNGDLDESVDVLVPLPSTSSMSPDISDVSGLSGEDFKVPEVARTE